MTSGSRSQSSRFVPVRVLPTPASLPSRPSTWPDRHVSRGHEARPETDDMRHPVYQIGTNIRHAYSAARVVRQEAESHSVTNAGRAPPCEIRRYAWLWLTEPPSAWADRTGRYGRHVAGHPVQREVILTAARPGGRARSPDAATCARERGSYWWARWRRLIRAEHRLAAFGDGMRSTARSLIRARLCPVTPPPRTLRLVAAHS
jgi:hypothetical protein